MNKEVIARARSLLDHGKPSVNRGHSICPSDTEINARDRERKLQIHKELINIEIVSGNEAPTSPLTANVV